MKIEIRKPTDEEKTKAKTWPIWEKEESKFDWSYSEQETCLIIEGKAQVATDSEVVEFAAGDFVIFPKGLNCKWIINKRIKKHYRFG